MLENELRASNQRLEEIVDGISREVDNSGEILSHMQPVIAYMRKNCHKNKHFNTKHWKGLKCFQCSEMYPDKKNSILKNGS